MTQSCQNKKGLLLVFGLLLFEKGVLFAKRFVKNPFWFVKILANNMFWFVKLFLVCAPCTMFEQNASRLCRTFGAAYTLSQAVDRSYVEYI